MRPYGRCAVATHACLSAASALARAPSAAFNRKSTRLARLTPRRRPLSSGHLQKEGAYDEALARRAPAHAEESVCSECSCAGRMKSEGKGWGGGRKGGGRKRGEGGGGWKDRNSAAVNNEGEAETKGGVTHTTPSTPSQVLWWGWGYRCPERRKGGGAQPVLVVSAQVIGLGGWWGGGGLKERQGMYGAILDVSWLRSKKVTLTD